MEETDLAALIAQVSSRLLLEVATGFFCFTGSVCYFLARPSRFLGQLLQADVSEVAPLGVLRRRSRRVGVFYSRRLLRWFGKVALRVLHRVDCARELFQSGCQPAAPAAHKDR